MRKTGREDGADRDRRQGRAIHSVARLCQLGPRQLPRSDQAAMTVRSGRIDGHIASPTQKRGINFLKHVQRDRSELLESIDIPRLALSSRRPLVHVFL